MLRRLRRDVCSICKRSLPRAAARCPWCSYGNDEPARSKTPRHPDDTLRKGTMRRMPHRNKFHATTL